MNSANRYLPATEEAFPAMQPVDHERLSGLVHTAVQHGIFTDEYTLQQALDTAHVNPRGAARSIETGQTERGRSLGVSELHALRAAQTIATSGLVRRITMNPGLVVPGISTPTASLINRIKADPVFHARNRAFNSDPGNQQHFLLAQTVVLRHAASFILDRTIHQTY